MRSATSGEGYLGWSAGRQVSESHTNGRFQIACPERYLLCLSSVPESESERERERERERGCIYVGVRKRDRERAIYSMHNSF